MIQREITYKHPSISYAVRISPPGQNILIGRKNYEDEWEYMINLGDTEEVEAFLALIHEAIKDLANETQINPL